MLSHRAEKKAINEIRYLLDKILENFNGIFYHENLILVLVKTRTVCLNYFAPRLLVSQIYKTYL